MPPAVPRERRRAVEDVGFAAEGYAPAAGVDEVRVGRLGGRQRTDADDAVLGLEHDLAPRRDVVRGQHRDADAEIDEDAVRQVLRGAPRHLLAPQGFREPRRGGAHRAATTASTRSTKTHDSCTSSGATGPST